MFRFTIVDVLWLTVVVGLACGCSFGDTDAAKKARMIQQVRDAKEITVFSFLDDGTTCEFTLKAQDKARLVSWLQRAARDDSPLKYAVRSELAFTNGGWSVLQIDDAENGIRVDESNYWRGLDRVEFDRILSDYCAPSTAAPAQP